MEKTITSATVVAHRIEAFRLTTESFEYGVVNAVYAARPHTWVVPAADTPREYSNLTLLRALPSRQRGTEVV